MKQRQLWPDLIRVVAIFLMVVLHVCAGYVLKYPNLPLMDWWMANLIESLTRACVPLFFILSGSLLLGKKEDLFDFYYKRLGRLIIPWGFWSLIYGLISILLGQEFDSLASFIMQTVWSGFWILPIFFVLYLVTPLFNWLMDRLGNDFTFLFLLIMGVVLMMGVHLPVYFEYSFFFILGSVLKKVDLNLIGTYLLGIFVIIIWFLIAVLTDFQSVMSNSLIQDYYHYYSWTVVLLSSSLFVLIKQITQFPSINKWQVVITDLSKASFAIYFIHMIIFKLDINMVLYPSYFFIPITSILIYLLSYLLVKSARENKVLSQLVG